MQAACTANTPPLPDALIAHYPIRRRRHRCSTDCAEAGAQRHRDDVEANGEDREMIEHVTCGDARVAAPLALIDGDFGKDRYAVGIATPRLDLDEHHLIGALVEHDEVRLALAAAISPVREYRARGSPDRCERAPLPVCRPPWRRGASRNSGSSMQARTMSSGVRRGSSLRCFLDMVYSFHEMGGRSMRRGFRQGACRCLQNPFPQARRFKQESNTPNLSRRNDVAGMRLQRVGR